MAKIEAKLEFLRLVMEHKHVLFGSFSGHKLDFWYLFQTLLTKSDKTQTWKKLHERAQTLTLVPHNKEYTYTRDTLWQNMKKIAMKKRDNSRATGTGTTNFTKTDHMIYDIIGKNTPNLDGLPVLESMVALADDYEEMPQNHSPPQKTKPKTTKKTKNTKKEELQLKKLILTVKLLKKENYYKRLQIMELERKLNISPTIDDSDNMSSDKENMQPTNNYDSDEVYMEQYLDNDYE